MELVTSSWAHCCSPRMVVVVVVVVVVTMHSVLSSPHLAAVGAAAGGVLAVDGPAILVTALQPVVDNLRHAVLRIREGPVAASESSRTLNTATRIGLHIPISLFCCTHRYCWESAKDSWVTCCRLSVSEVKMATRSAVEGSLKLTMVWPY